MQRGRIKKERAASEIFRVPALVTVLATALSLDAAAQQPGVGPVDLSGVWRRQIEEIVPLVGGDVPFQSWAREVFDEVNSEMEAGQPFVDNRTLCLPDGGVDVMFPPYLIQFVQTPTRLHMLVEFNNQVRTVHLDGTHPTDLQASWNGHSIGRWEGDILTVETIGFNDRTPLMTLFHGLSTRTNIPHTEALRVVEQYGLSDDGSTLTSRMTIDDPRAFTERWTIEVAYARQEERLTEFVCADYPGFSDVDNPLDLEGLITVGADGEFPLDLDKLAPTQ